MAKIIKGTSDAGQRPHAPVARSPQVAGGDHKVINKEVFSAKGKAEDIHKEARESAAGRGRLAEEQAQKAYNDAHEAASRKARGEALEAILRAYKSRGDDLMAAWDQCLALASGVVARITGVKLSVTEAEARTVIEQGLKMRRGKFAAVIKLPAEDIEKLRAHPPLAAALPDVPEFVLEAGDGVVVVSGGEIPVDYAMAAQVLCRVLDVEPLIIEVPAPVEVPEESAAEEEEAPAEEAAPEEEAAEAASDEEEAPAEAEEEAAAEEEEAAPPPEEGTGGGFVVEAEAFSEELEQQDPPANDAESEAVADEELPQEIADQFEVVEEVSSQRRAPPPPERREPSVVMAVEKSAITRTTNRAVPLPAARSNSEPRVPIDGTRVEMGGNQSRSMTRPGSSPTGSTRAAEIPRRPDVTSDGEAATMAINREDVGLSKRPLPLPPSRGAAPVDGTRVDVRNAPSNLVKKPLR